MTDLSLIAAVNDEQVLGNTLLRSPVASHCQVILKRGFSSAAEAYNKAMAETRNELAVLVHQDVYLPESWRGNLERALAHLHAVDPSWGVLGVYGIRTDHQPAGCVYSTGLQRLLGAPFPEPLEAESLDEVLLIVRPSTGLRFDESLTGFHLYGTDLCLEARRRKMNSYIISAPCIHNSRGIPYLPSSFWSAYFFLQRKWHSNLPVTTCCTTISKGYVRPTMYFARAAVRRALFGPPKVGERCADPAALCNAIEATLLRGMPTPAARN